MNHYLLNLSSRIFFGSCRSIQSKAYKSIYSIDNLFPNSKVDLSPKAFNNQESKGPEKFNGNINFDDLKISYTKSSGPGGQNVNKVNSKVEIRFHVPSASWIPESVKATFVQKEASRINKQGFFIITSDKTRKQLLNQGDCLEKIRAALFACNDNRHIPTEEELALTKARNDKIRASILVDKRKHSMKKQLRQAPSAHDL